MNEAEPARQALQAEGKHPAPCARHCESTAYEIEIRNLKASLEAQMLSARHWKANHDAQVERARILIERPDIPFERVQAYQKWAELKRGHDRYEALRILNVAQFKELFQRNLAGENFDAMVDELVIQAAR